MGGRNFKFPHCVSGLWDSSGEDPPLVEAKTSQGSKRINCVIRCDVTLSSKPVGVNPQRETVLNDTRAI